MGHLAILKAFTILVVLVSVGAFSHGWARVKASNGIALQGAAKPTTYVPVTFKAPKTLETDTVLVKNGNNDVINTLKSWTTKQKVDDIQSMIEDWSRDGVAFWMTPQGTRSIHLAERKEYKLSDIDSDDYDKNTHAEEELNNTMQYTSNTYVQVGTTENPLFIKSSKVGILLGSMDKGSTIEYMLKCGDAFTSTTTLMAVDKVLNRADAIATRLDSDYSMMSPEWKRWIEKTAGYNATSLKQVIAAYYQDYSIADVGSKDGDYVPRRGYPGTLAPGEKFKDNYPIEELPNYILHPWPAMQEFQFHVRWPPAHPLISPPLLWIGQNSMYTDKFIATVTAEPRDDVIGGTMMNPSDAIHIAEFHDLGSSYELGDQVAHGGSLFPGGHQIPFYTPDHGPTIPHEEAELTIPHELVPVTTRWLDPHYGLDLDVVGISCKDEGANQLREEQDEEEAERRAAALQYMQEQGISQKEAVDAGIDRDGEKSKYELELSKILTDRYRALFPTRKIRTKTADGHEIAEMNHADPLAPNYVGQEERIASEISIAVSGRARSKKGLIDYSIATIRDLGTEVDRVEKVTFQAKSKPGRKARGKGKKKTNEE